jgi:hypothetical protein
MLKVYTAIYASFNFVFFECIKFSQRMKKAFRRIKGIRTNPILLDFSYGTIELISHFFHVTLGFGQLVTSILLLNSTIGNELGGILALSFMGANIILFFLTATVFCIFGVTAGIFTLFFGMLRKRLGWKRRGL